MVCILRIPFGHAVGHVFFQSQRRQAVFCQVHTAFKLLLQLVRSHHEMALGNGKLANTGQSVHLAGILVAEKCGGLAVSAWQVAVGLGALFVYVILEWAGHGAQCEHFVVLLLVTQHEHSFFVVIPVIGNHV